jgi:hypothetical protein
VTSEKMETEIEFKIETQEIIEIVETIETIETEDI